MQYYSVRELRANTGAIWGNLAESGELVITNNGKPAALMLDISGASGADLEETLAMVRQARVMRALNDIRLASVENGLDTLSGEEIEAEIRAARDGR